MSGPSGMGKPAFMPASVRSQQAQQVQNVPIEAGDPEERQICDDALAGSCCYSSVPCCGYL